MKCGPLVIVGQARSGSTLITRMLADTGHFLLVNDAYYLQMADDVGRGETLTAAEAATLAERVLARMRKRAITPDVQTVSRSVHLSEEELAALEADLPQIIPTGGRPEAVIAAILERAAEMSGARVWGWNSPQDYLLAARLIRLFPEARILFLIRNPFDVLGSYKNLPEYWGGERNRYHPAVQSLVWRNVVREYLRLKLHYPEHVRLVRYEDVAAPDSTVWAGLLDFLDDFPAPAPASAYSRNSSKAQADRKKTPVPLSRIEVSLCRAITGPYLARFGYAAPAETSALGVTDFGRVSARFLGYYSRQAARSRDMRRRIKRLGTSIMPKAE